LINGGIDGIVLLGSTGEFFALTKEQKRELICAAVAHVGNRVELIVGTGCLRVDQTIALSNFALEAGADAVMVVPPYYFALADDAIFAYFDAVASAVSGPIYLYNFPARTGYDIGVAVTRKLLRKHPNIVGYKDTVFEVGHTRELASHLLPEFPNFKILAGFDEWGQRIVASGGAGVIGGLSNLYPGICATYMAAINRGDAEETARQQRKIDQLMDLYSLGTPFVPILKAALVMQGIVQSEACVAPLQPATQTQREGISKIIAKVESL
jgi:4-hydroxy-tetrahydrodipicolinate synthase